MRRLYSWLLTLLLPIALLRLWWRGRKQPGYRDDWQQRLGRNYPATTGPVIWLHAVSLGETRAAAPLVRELLARFPQHRLLLTHTTPTGRAAAQELFGDGVLRCYLPYDLPFALRRFLRHFRPVCALVMETELWPNLLALCKAQGIPTALLNARLSQRSAAGYAHFAALTSQTMGNLTLVAAQTDADAQRLRALGAGNVQVCGNIKFDTAVPQPQRALGQEFRQRFGTRPIWLAASTRDGEEALLLDAHAHLATASALLVLVPRHPQRFDAVAQLIAARGLRAQRRSTAEPIDAQTQVLLGDSMGELYAYYCACDLAYIGGSLLPFGGQNLIEACAAGAPVLIGPHTYNFQEAAELAIQAGAALRVTDAEQLRRCVEELFADATRRAAMSAAGQRFVAAHQGATERTLALIAPLLGPASTRR